VISSLQFERVLGSGAAVVESRALMTAVIEDVRGRLAAIPFGAALDAARVQKFGCCWPGWRCVRGVVWRGHRCSKPVARGPQPRLRPIEATPCHERSDHPGQQPAELLHARRIERRAERDRRQAATHVFDHRGHQRARLHHRRTGPEYAFELQRADQRLPYVGGATLDRQRHLVVVGCTASVAAGGRGRCARPPAGTRSSSASRNGHSSRRMPIEFVRHQRNRPSASANAPPDSMPMPRARGGAARRAAVAWPLARGR